MVQFIKDYGQIIAIFGAILPASVAYFYKVKAERQKSAKRVLYHLLEIRHSLYMQILGSNESRDAFKHNDLKDDKHEKLIKDFSPLIDTFFDQVSNSCFDADKYTNELSQLSNDYPYLSYRISDKQYLDRSYKLHESYTTEGKQIIDNYEGLTKLDKYILTETVKRAKMMHNSELFADIDKDIRSLAWKSGLRTYIFILIFLHAKRYDKTVANLSESIVKDKVEFANEIINEIIKETPQELLKELESETV